MCQQGEGGSRGVPRVWRGTGVNHGRRFQGVPIALSTPPHPSQSPKMHPLPPATRSPTRSPSFPHLSLARLSPRLPLICLPLSPRLLLAHPSPCCSPCPLACHSLTCPHPLTCCSFTHPHPLSLSPPVHLLLSRCRGLPSWKPTQSLSATSQLQPSFVLPQANLGMCFAGRQAGRQRGSLCMLQSQGLAD